MEQKLRKLGITPEINGFYYILDGCELLANSKEILKTKITSEVYTYIAKKRNTTPFRVERCIRHAIARSYNKGHLKNLYIGKPTNKLFLIDLTEGNI